MPACQDNNYAHTGSDANQHDARGPPNKSTSARFQTQRTFSASSRRTSVPQTGAQSAGALRPLFVAPPVLAVSPPAAPSSPAAVDTGLATSGAAAQPRTGRKSGRLPGEDSAP